MSPSLVDRSLQGRRILIVEDEMLIALVIEEALADLGCKIVGPAARIAKAMPLAQSEPLDAAFLDINVAHEPVYPVADALAARGVPVVFLTGYGEASVDSGYADRPVLKKPFTVQDLQRALESVLSPVGQS